MEVLLAGVLVTGVCGAVLLAYLVLINN